MSGRVQRGVATLLIVVSAVLLASCGDDSASPSSADGSSRSERQSTTTTPVATPDDERTGIDPESGLEWVRVDDLPSEAFDTLVLIDDGGPFPFERDGITFENREGILPDEPVGYYEEYTVFTPGEDDRGARRIVAGDADDERYYTADHYDSFVRVVWP